MKNVPHWKNKIPASNAEDCVDVTDFQFGKEMLDSRILIGQLYQEHLTGKHTKSKNSHIRKHTSEPLNNSTE